MLTPEEKARTLYKRGWRLLTSGLQSGRPWEPHDVSRWHPKEGRTLIAVPVKDREIGFYLRSPRLQAEFGGERSWSDGTNSDTWEILDLLGLPQTQDSWKVAEALCDLTMV